MPPIHNTDVGRSGPCREPPLRPRLLRQNHQLHNDADLISVIIVSNDACYRRREQDDVSVAPALNDDVIDHLVNDVTSGILVAYLERLSMNNSQLCSQDLSVNNARYIDIFQ
ncbi:hypothetical protein KGM_202710 [Danaus plexippus plexippus]|uniref:Uncharacterized protein n=1 Tax=Danaus plexippus plexippus TaxID=278856 RepID=A0A212FJ58_DANPL|nr:hypothetical protein KGM_202710 [Danaus plexippus plexippus]